MTRLPPTERGPRLELRPALALILAAATLVVGVWLGVLIGGLGGGGDTLRGAKRLRLEPLGSLAPRATGSASVTGGRIRVSVSGVAPRPRGRYYEVWEYTDRSHLVSAGGFRVPASGQATFNSSLPADPRDYRAIDVSLEAADGNPGHSGQSVLRGRIPAG